MTRKRVKAIFSPAGLMKILFNNSSPSPPGLINFTYYMLRNLNESPQTQLLKSVRLGNAMPAQ